MKASEIRIGNWIDVKEHPFPDRIPFGIQAFDSWYWFYELSLDENALEPIPLTEEWLLKFGFEKWLFNRHRYFKKKSKNTFMIEHTIEGFYFTYDNNAITVTEVHQLQNLYFALTGEELMLSTQDSLLNTND